MSSARRIGFIGLGSQGAPLAMKLVEAGLDVTVWDQRAEALAPFAAAGAKIAKDAADLGARCDFVEICVLDDAGVNETVAGPAGLLKTMAAGGLIAVHSTVSAQTCRSLAREAAASGVILIDAPVSGGAPRAALGQMLVMIGGDARSFDICREVFAAFANTIVHLGEVGAGQLAKGLNNVLMAANFVLAHEALEAGLALGLDRDALVAALKNGSASSFALDALAPLASIKDFQHGARLLKKDVAIMRAAVNSPAAEQVAVVADRLQDHVFGA